MTKILSIDLGKFKSVACLYQQKAQPVFRTFATMPAALHDLLVELEPDRVVIEVCGIAGWIHGLCVSLDLPISRRPTSCAPCKTECSVSSRVVI